MKIHRITFSNILSYGNKRNVVEFGEEGSLVGITGKNGEGKSSCLDAVCYALYGNPFRKINKQQLINRINLKDLYTKVEFENNSIEWVIERGMNPNFIKIWKNGVEVELEAHVYDIQKYINLNIVGINENIFRTIVMVQMRNFKSFFTLSKEKRRELFENAIDIITLSNMRRFFQARLNDLERDQSTKSIELKYTKERMNTHNNQLKNINDISNNSIDDLEKQIVEYSQSIESKMSIFKDKYKTPKEKLVQKNTEYNKAIHNLEFQGVELTKQMKKHLKNIEFYKKNDKCFQCNKRLTQQEKEEQIEIINADVDKLTKEIESVAKEYSEKEEQQKQIAQEIDSFIKDQNEINTMKGKLSDIEKKRDEFIAFTSSSKIKDDIEKQLKLDEQKIVDLNSDIEECGNNIEVANNFKYILSDEGLKKYIYMKFLPILNFHVNNILNKFEFNIKFILGENLDEKIITKTGEEVKIETFSSGEQQLIDVAFMFGLQHFLEKINNFSNDSIFIDELLDASIDQENLDKIVNFIRELNKNIIIITHKNNVKDYFDISYNIRKEGSFSQIYRESN